VSSTANNPFFSDATTEAAVNAVAALLNSGNISIYTGSQPTDANTAIGAQVLLASMAFGSTAFASAVASGTAPAKVVTATANSITSDTNAAATGTATWFRCYKSDGVTGVMDGAVGTSGSDLNLNTTSIVSGATVAVTAFSITQAE
jgi:hypothetical protein